MSFDSQLAAETRGETVFRYVRKQLNERRITKETFAMNMVEEYHSRVSLAARRIEFSSNGDKFRQATTNAQRFFRFEDLTAAGLPADLEEAAVAALEEPYRTECRRALAARYGLLDVPVPKVEGINPVQSVAAFTREFSGALGSLAECVADGKVTAEDAEHAAAALPHLRSVIATAEGLLAQLTPVAVAVVP